MKNILKIIYGKIIEIINKISPFVLALAVSLVIFGTAFYKMGSSSIQNLILAMTFFAIFWYSLETRKLKNATRFANAIQVEPLLVLQSEGDKLYIINYGKGPAFNIEMKIENIQNFFNFSIPNPNPLGHMEKRSLSINEQQLNQDIVAKVDLFFDNFEKKNRERRQRFYKITKVVNGWYIEYIG